MHPIPLLYLGIIRLSADAVVDSSLEQCLQPDNVDSGEYNDIGNMPPNVCTRTCRGGEGKTCYYKFFIEQWITMAESCGNCTTSSPLDCFKEFCVTADGFERSILAINRKMPGPSIQVCKGDKIVVDVTNMLPGRSTTIHWHGIRQRHSQFMDGVPMVTQCPIPEATTFRYTFNADDPGTQFYHSHDGLQKVDGLVGSLVIRVPTDEDPNKDLYDMDLPSHVVLIQDWHHHIADEIFPGLRNRGISQIPQTFLIQGRGIYRNSNGTKLAETPIAEFNVTSGLRYVFRIIAATCYQCQYVLNIENHEMTIIGADGSSTEPYKVDSLTMSPGERFDVVINCNRGVNAYWIMVRTIGFCDVPRRAYQVGVLRYEGHEGPATSPEPGLTHTPMDHPGITVNPYNSNCTEQEKNKLGPCAQDLRSATDIPDSRIVDYEPDYRIIWGLGFFVYPNQTPSTDDQRYGKFLRGPKNHVAFTVNGVAFELPPSPLLSQFDDIPKSKICPEEGLPNLSWNEEHRQCVNIIRVPSHSVVEIVMIDTVLLKMSHPVHLHGYQMYVIEQGLLLTSPNEKLQEDTLKTLSDYIMSRNRKEIPKKPVAKDTVPLMAGGFAVVRIFTDNPGYWLFHCHFALHLDSGMAGVLQVGERTDFPPPPDHFPTCGDYLPEP